MLGKVKLLRVPSLRADGVWKVYSPWLCCIPVFMYIYSQIRILQRSSEVFFLVMLHMFGANQLQEGPLATLPNRPQA